MNRGKIKTLNFAMLAVYTTLLVSGCAQPHYSEGRVPSLEYARRVKSDLASAQTPETVGSFGELQVQRHGKPNGAQVSEAHFGQNSATRAQLRLASGELPPEEAIAGASGVYGMEGSAGYAPVYSVEESEAPLTRDYRGPLNLGDPGVSASLWKESRGGNDFFRDYRAWQPMDLVTIVVSEVSEGKKEADTSVALDSSISASIQRLFGVETWNALLKNNIDPSQPLIQAESSHDWEGEGETTRKGSLKAKISAMVVEVLPSGILRIEGEKIIAVNNEDEVMVISGLVRPEDISSNNEVDSSKVGNVRIDYYGRGTVGDAQTGGWLGNIIRRVWPF